MKFDPSYDLAKFLKKKNTIFGKFLNKNFAKIASDLILGPTLSGATQTNSSDDLFSEVVFVFLEFWNPVLGCELTDYPWRGAV